MVLRFEELKVKNFKTYEEGHFSFTNGHNVILGENGAGKSSIFEAITFSMFGAVPGKVAASLIRHGQTSMEVSLSFVTNGINYRVERNVSARKSNAMLYRTESETSREKLIAEKSKTVNEEVEKLLGLSNYIFTNVIYIPQGQISAIASDSPKARRELFDKILGYSLYAKVSERLRVSAKTTEGTIGSFDELTKTLTEDIKKKEQLESDVEELETRLKQLQTELNTILPHLSEKTNAYQELKERHQLVLQLEERAKAQEEELQRSKDKVKNLLSNLGSRLGREFKADKEQIAQWLLNYATKLQNIEKTIAELTQDVDTGKRIETTLQNLEDFKLRFIKEKESIEHKIAEKSTNIKGSSSPIEQQITELKQIIEKCDSQIETIESRLEKEIEVDKERSVLNERFSNCKSELEELDGKIKKSNNQIKKNLGKFDKNEFLSRNIADEKLNQQKKLNELREQLLKIESTRVSLKDQLSSETDLLTTLGKTKDKNCPLCGQTLTKAHITKIQEEKAQLIEQIKGKIALIEQEKPSNEQTIEETEKTRQILEQQEQQQLLVKQQSEQLEALLEQKTELETEVKKLEVQTQTSGDKTAITLLRGQKKQVEEEQDNLRKQMESIQEIKQLTEQITHLKTKISEKEKETAINKANDHYIMLEKNKREFDESRNTEKDYHDIINNLEQVRDEISSNDTIKEQFNETKIILKSRKAEFDEEAYNKLEGEVNKLKEKSIEHETMIKTIKKDQIPEKQKQINDIKKKEKQLAQVQKDFLCSQKKLESITQVRELTKEIVPYLRRQHVQSISEYSSEIFLYLMNNEEYEGLEVTEEYELNVLQSGEKHDVTMLSGGEQIIACLAIRLAIAKLLADQDILLLDEPTIMLDNYRRKELVEVFEKTRLVGQTVIVSHDMEFERVADTTFTIVKENGHSHVVAEEIDHIVAEQKQYKEITLQRFKQLEL